LNDALQHAGKTVQLATFPNEGHQWPSWSRRDLISMMQKVQDFLDQNIGPHAGAPAPATAPTHAP
jgi:dipeptidyl aminopeptidase/acylaminoacyl peptidase